MILQRDYRSARTLRAALLCLLFSAAITGSKADATVPGLDLTGIVKSAEAPIAGASAFIYTAGPRLGPGGI
ncbi:MAG: hypothetical protein O2960_19315 [Verrucomicrobia bacterium]|nr:hypothetical protein [Verrucomicrobiota bacterium]